MIKFRAWDKENNTRLTWEQLKSEADFSWFADENLVFMQSTGLKDKNGVDIYEGDILNFVTTEFNGSYFDTEHTEKVEFSNGTYFVGTYDLGEVLLDDLRAEIIGNIHKNSELLEETE